MDIGRRIWFDVISGEVIVDTGERTGSVISRTPEQDVQTFRALVERVSESYDFIDLAYGEYAEDFRLSKSVAVDPATKSLLFEYRDDTSAEQPVFQPSYKEQIATVNAEVDSLGQQLVAKDLQLLQLQGDNDALGQQLVAKDLEILALQSDNQTLGQQLVGLDLRLSALEGGASA